MSGGRYKCRCTFTIYVEAENESEASKIARGHVIQMCLEERETPYSGVVCVCREEEGVEG